MFSRATRLYFTNLFHSICSLGRWSTTELQWHHFCQSLINLLICQALINLLIPQTMLPYLIFSSSLILCDPKNFLSANNTLQFISELLFSFLFCNRTLLIYHLFIQNSLFIFILHLCLAPANTFLLHIPLTLYLIQRFYVNDMTFFLFLPLNYWRFSQVLLS